MNDSITLSDADRLTGIETAERFLALLTPEFLDLLKILARKENRLKASLPFTDETLEQERIAEEAIRTACGGNEALLSACARSSDPQNGLSAIFQQLKLPEIGSAVTGLSPDIAILPTMRGFAERIHEALQPNDSRDASTAAIQRVYQDMQAKGLTSGFMMRMIRDELIDSATNPDAFAWQLAVLSDDAVARTNEQNTVSLHDSDTRQKLDEQRKTIEPVSTLAAQALRLALPRTKHARGEVESVFNGRVDNDGDAIRDPLQMAWDDFKKEEKRRTDGPGSRKRSEDIYL